MLDHDKWKVSATASLSSGSWRPVPRLKFWKHSKRVCTGWAQGGERHASIYMVSEMAAALVRARKMGSFGDVREAFEAALAAMGEDSRVIVLPQAGSIMQKIGLKNDLDALLSGVHRSNHRKG